MSVSRSTVSKKAVVQPAKSTTTPTQKKQTQTNKNAHNTTTSNKKKQKEIELEEEEEEEESDQDEEEETDGEHDMDAEDSEDAEEEMIEDDEDGEDFAHDDNADDEDAEEGDDQDAEGEGEDAGESYEDGEDNEGDEEESSGPSLPISKSPHSLKVDTADSNAYAEALAQRGVVYLSRIPPYMKAAKLRWLLEQLIPKQKKNRRIGRIFLTPEDQAAARRRKKSGGNGGKKFIDGWVEFESKKVARWVAETFNAQPMGGPKRSRYAEDLWTLKYLKGFKWHHLTEKIAYEKQIRSTKIREEMTQANRESEYYLNQVDRSRKLEQLADKKQKGEKRKATSNENDSNKKSRTAEGESGPIRRFHQRALLDQPKKKTL